MTERALPAVAFGSGLVFAIGLGVAGMTRPERIRGFLDLFGEWDPSLLFVMAAAVPVHALAWWFLARRGAPLMGGRNPGRPAPVFDARLIGGAALFGVGWGLAGVCPGPAVVGVVTGGGALVFFPAVLAGVALSRLVAKAPAMEGVMEEGVEGG